MKSWCSRRLELHTAKFAAATYHFSTAEVGELIKMLMAEVGLEEVPPPSCDAVKSAFEARSEYRRIKGSFGRDSLPLSVRRNIFERDGRKCRYCCADLIWETYECDHVHPVSLRGTSHESNLAASCKSCNRKKGAKTLAQWVGAR